MLSKGLNLGGEQSGHIIFLEHNTTGDGLLTAIQLMQVIAESGANLSELAAKLTNYPQVLQNIRVRSKAAWEENEAILECINNAKNVLGERGRIFVRASGTEPLIRVMAEGPEQSELERLVSKVVAIIDKELNS